jgi:hypothetical protein
MKETSLSPRVSVPATTKVLLIDTNRWPVTARLAIAFTRMNCIVAAVCPMPNHPIQKVRGVQRVFRYSGHSPLKSLRRAIEAFDPDIVIPSCDRSVLHLHELHALSQQQGSSGEKIALLIERSLGPPESFPVVSGRYDLLIAARDEGILVPETVAANTVTHLNQLIVAMNKPWVIKADGTWGGRGVRVAHSVTEANEHYLELTQPVRALDLIKRLILDHDRDFALLDWRRRRPAVIAQSFIDGRPANCAVVCWRGKVLAGIAVEVISAQGSKGPATIVQVVQGTEMLAAAEKIARRLSLSGFFGLDFMIENKTGATYLIEMNPRCTPPCPLPLANQRNLAAAMLTQLTSQPLPEDQPVIKESIIAYFPQVRASVGELPDVNLRNSIYHDIPQGEPELIRELLHPKSERSMAGKLVDLSRRVWFQEKISKSCDFDGATPPQVAAIADPDGPV